MKNLSSGDADEYELKPVETPFGTIVVAKQGAEYNPTQSKPAILTYHDIGLNHVSNFQSFFNYMDMRLLLKSFSVFHINAPGQEENAPPLPNGYTYPTMDELAEQVELVCKSLNIKSVICFGVGVGANILSRFALRWGSMVDGLFLVNATSSQSGWSEWLYQKMNVYYLNSNSSGETFPQSIRDYLMWHHFGKVTDERNRDLIEAHRSYFNGQNVNGVNLARFIDSYIKRTDLGLIRGDKNKNFKCPVLLMCGAFSPHVNDTVEMNTRLDPVNSTWMKLSDCAMVLEEQPGKVEEAMRLFIQGLGYALSAYERRRSSLRRASLKSQESVEESTPVRKAPIKEEEDVHVTENPME